MNTFTQVFLLSAICLFLIGAVIIELRAHYLIRVAMHSNVSAMFAQDADAAEQHHSSYDKTDDQNKAHRFISFGPMK